MLQLARERLTLNATTMTFHMPEDTEFLKAFARVSIAHGHLDYSLRMCIKSLADLSIQEAVDATEGEGSASLRDRIKKLARMRLGEGQALLRLQAILRCCKDETEKRNGLIHTVVAMEEGGAPKVRNSDHSWSELPKSAELNELSLALSCLAAELNHARLRGFLFEALANRPLPDRS